MGSSAANKWPPTFARPLKIHHSNSLCRTQATNRCSANSVINILIIKSQRLLQHPKCDFLRQCNQWASPGGNLVIYFYLLPMQGVIAWRQNKCGNCYMSWLRAFSWKCWRLFPQHPQPELTSLLGTSCLLSFLVRFSLNFIKAKGMAFNSAWNQ